MEKNFSYSGILTAKQAKEIDIRVQKKFGISTLVLMENAGRAVVCEALKALPYKGQAAIFCGRGNNGGDGFVAARHLLISGVKLHIFLAGRIQDVENEAKINLGILLRLKQKITEIREDSLCIHHRSLRRGEASFLFENKISKYDLIVDALLGVGLAGEVRGICRGLIGVINTSKAYILSVDIPSGLDATTGKVLGCCVKANKTVTFIAKKRGMVINDGPKYCGRIVVKDLGIPVKRVEGKEKRE
ncbi:MAG: NAD(P)H-hydrate epimerase [Candidatus Omnitrophota bacterium]|nr:NAD(P)H-hydrate epimerase [Candidatus Omnitrophota bacterium]